MIIVALGHEKDVGKDVGCQALLRHFRFKTKGKSIQIGSFAYAPKLEFSKLFKKYGVQPLSYYEEDKTRKEEFLPQLNMTYREGLIKFANGVRSVYENFWLDYLIETHKNTDILFISDLRFNNEFDYVIENKGFTIKITRPGKGGDVDGADDVLSKRTDWSGYVINDGDLKDYFQILVTVVDELFARNKIIF